MRRINVAVVGTGWIGDIRAVTCAKHPLVDQLYLADIDETRVRHVAEKTGAHRWTTDHRELLGEDVDAVIISAAPESLHYPMAREWLQAGKHVLLEKPMAETLSEADELVGLAAQVGVKFTIGYTQRYNPKFAYLKQSVADHTLGKPVTALISRHLTRALGAKIAGRGKLGPAQMEATHDIDLVLWWMDPARTKRVYAQAADGIMREPYDLPDSIWIVLTMDSGATATVGAHWNLPPESPGFSGTQFEFVCTDGAVFIDDSHRDILLSTVGKGLMRPMSTMPGQPIGHVYQGPMQDETRAFIEAVALDQPVLVTPEQALRVMEVTLAADLSAERGEPIELPLTRD